MFNRKKGKNVLTPEQLKAMNQDNLYLLFNQDKWTSFTESSRLALLQEVENRRAAADGRKPVKIHIGDKKQFEDPGALGYYNDNNKEIHINYRYFSGNSPWHSGAGALSVVLHEGRHAYQHFRLDNGVKDDSAQVLKEWLSARISYVSPGFSEESIALYGLQSIEDDARRFARREIQRILNNMLIRGINCQSFLTEYRNLLQEETNFILMIRENLTIEDIDCLEKLFIQDMKEQFPNLNIRDLSLFDNAKLILKAKLDNYDDLTLLLDKLDKIADEKLNQIQSKKLNRISNKL